MSLKPSTAKKLSLIHEDSEPLVEHRPKTPEKINTEPEVKCDFDGGQLTRVNCMSGSSQTTSSTFTQKLKTNRPLIQGEELTPKPGTQKTQQVSKTNRVIAQRNILPATQKNTEVKTIVVETPKKPERPETSIKIWMPWQPASGIEDHPI